MKLKNYTVPIFVTSLFLTIQASASWGISFIACTTPWPNNPVFQTVSYLNLKSDVDIAFVEQVRLADSSSPHQSTYPEYAHIAHFASIRHKSEPNASGSGTHLSGYELSAGMDFDGKGISRKIKVNVYFTDYHSLSNYEPSRAKINIIYPDWSEEVARQIPDCQVATYH